METSAKIWMGVAILLFFVILGMTWVLFTVPAVSTVAPVSTSTIKQVSTVTIKPQGDAPLSARVTITSPLKNTTVGSIFVIKGSAPGNWYFEASFPIQVRDTGGNVVGRTHASAQGDAMTTADVPFTATVNIENNYKGPATLILMRDNPSGLPENDDSTEIPVVIQ